VHYVDEGAGRVLLFLHGNPTWSFLYRDLIKPLRRRFRCIALDYPGFGRSQPSASYGFKPDEHAHIVQSFIERLDLRDISLMVHDWGGPIGLGAAGRCPERFASLIIGNTMAWPVNGDKHMEQFSKMMGGPVGKFLIYNANAFVNFMIPYAMKTRKPSKAVMDAYRGPFKIKASRRPMHVFPQQILAAREYLKTVEAGLVKLKHLPVLIVWPDKDIAYRDVELARLKMHFPTSRVVMLEGIGHYIQEEVPERLTAQIERWMESNFSET
jgi:haloalkane dehalogenase